MEPFIVVPRMPEYHRYDFVDRPALPATAQLNSILSSSAPAAELDKIIDRYRERDKSILGWGLIYADRDKNFIIERGSPLIGEQGGYFDNITDHQDGAKFTVVNGIITIDLAIGEHKAYVKKLLSLQDGIDANLLEIYRRYYSAGKDSIDIQDLYDNIASGFKRRPDMRHLLRNRITGLSIEKYRLEKHPINMPFTGIKTLESIECVEAFSRFLGDGNEDKFFPLHEGIPIIRQLFSELTANATIDVVHGLGKCLFHRDALIHISEAVNNATSRGHAGNIYLAIAEADEGLARFTIMDDGGGVPRDLMEVYAQRGGSSRKSDVLSSPGQGIPDMVEYASRFGKHLEWKSYNEREGYNYSVILRLGTNGRIDLEDLDDHKGSSFQLGSSGSEITFFVPYFTL